MSLDIILFQKSIMSLYIVVRYYSFNKKIYND